MQPPRRPPDHLHVVGKDERKVNPYAQYRDMFIGAVVVTIATVTTTLGVHWLAGRASRKREREESNPQPQLPAQGYFPQQQPSGQFFAPSPFAMPPAMPPGGMWIYAPQGMPGVGAPTPQPALTMPSALRQSASGRNKPASNQAGPPAWFSSWANEFVKTQDERFEMIETKLGEFAEGDDEGEYEDVG